jgi:ADP-ribose pyrophosphatase YjhB (NUDIX family)
MASLGGSRHPLQAAIQTEILEEAGLNIEDEEAAITRVFVGGNPTHVLCMSVLNIADENAWRAISRSEHKAEEEDIVAVETIPLAVLLPCPDTLPVMTRTALQSFISWMECGGART